ncbi:hypothetical protein MTBSS4_810004 [Magnetospirillum sp. SS-4]|nr:hypothetical protein MTBSS4_810004 [Magnetospirillum sp. SS-4]
MFSPNFDWRSLQQGMRLRLSLSSGCHTCYLKQNS